MRFPPFELVDWFAAAEGRFDISLSHSDCEPLNVSDLMDERQLAEFTNTRLGYGQFAGLDELRSLVAEQYETLEQNDVLICNGASEAIYTFMRTNLSAGDEIVAASPVFHTLHAIARSMDCTVRDWRWDEATCAFDVSALESLCSAQTKLIVFNFPHNPSGQTITESDLRRIVEIARWHDANILSDEQFRQLELPIRGDTTGRLRSLRQSGLGNGRVQDARAWRPPPRLAGDATRGNSSPRRRNTGTTQRKCPTFPARFSHAGHWNGVRRS